MEDELNNFPEGTKRQDVNYMRINGINLVQDADDLVNLYLKIAKKFPE